jgi:uncharacterized protein CbrC (UPF0167 family)
MGTTFQNIAESALESSELDDCQCCERAGVASYDYRGEMADPSTVANPQLAEEEPKIHAACAHCINGGFVRKDEYEIGEIQSIISTFTSEKEKVAQQYHRTPNIPLMMQREDWPMCCGDWCEYIGAPADYDESVQVPACHQFWNRRPVEPHWDLELKPESLRDVCIFRCHSCDKTYFIWQPT